MRRLMTGHAITFNKRHKRAGHLFQNRYKSVVCEEDNYLLELTRYIHLNPLRAKLVKNLNELEKYPWAGHSTILDHRKNPFIPDPPAERDEEETEQPDKSLAEKTVEDVLLHFGKKLEDARKKYRQFVKDGIERGRQPEFQGGGLIRSQGGDRAGLFGLRFEEREESDQRVLGSGDFVNEALMKAGKAWEKTREKKAPLAQLIREVASHRALIFVFRPLISDF